MNRQWVQALCAAALLGVGVALAAVADRDRSTVSVIRVNDERYARFEVLMREADGTFRVTTMAVSLDVLLDLRDIRPDTRGE